MARAASATEPHTVMAAPTARLRGSPHYYSRAVPCEGQESEEKKDGEGGNGKDRAMEERRRKKVQYDTIVEEDAEEVSGDEHTPLLLSGSSGSSSTAMRGGWGGGGGEARAETNNPSDHTVLRMDPLDSDSHSQATIVNVFAFSSTTARMGVVALCRTSTGEPATLHVFFKVGIGGRGEKGRLREDVMKRKNEKSSSSQSSLALVLSNPPLPSIGLT